MEWKLGMRVHACNPSTKEVKIGESRSRSQGGLTGRPSLTREGGWGRWQLLYNFRPEFTSWKEEKDIMIQYKMTNWY
jgi:hypothetical protein